MKRFTSIHRNILIYYLLSAFTSFWFISSNWIYFWTKYMTFGTLGWVDGLAFAFSILLEIPSGAIADIIGKKKTIITAMLAGSIGTILIAAASNFTQITFGWFITQIAFSFYSGAGEALAYDTLINKRVEDKWSNVTANSVSIDTFTSAATNFLGGFLFIVWFRLPQYLWALGFILGFIASLFLIEPKVDSIKFSISNYFAQIKLGTKELFSTNLKKYAVYIFTLSGVYFLYSWGFIRPAIATSFGFFAKEQSIIFALLTLTSIPLVKSIPYLKSKFSEMRMLIALTILMSIGFLISSFNVGYYGVIALFLIAFSSKIANPWISIVINKEISSKYRATTLSTVAFITKIPYVLIAVIAGKLIEQGNIHYLTFGIFGFMTLVLAFSFVWNRKNVNQT